MLRVPAIKACAGLCAAVMTGPGVLIGGGLQPPGGWQGSSQQDRLPRGRLVTIDSGQQETPSWGCSTQKDTVTSAVVQAAV